MILRINWAAINWAGINGLACLYRVDRLAGKLRQQPHACQSIDQRHHANPELRDRRKGFGLHGIHQECIEDVQRKHQPEPGVIQSENAGKHGGGLKSLVNHSLRGGRL
jgi:hypothetical protein